MPGKYSHSVVLAHYSSQGIISLPNDKQTEYFTDRAQIRAVSTPTSRQRTASIAASSTPASVATRSTKTPSSQATVRQYDLTLPARPRRRKRQVIVESESDADDANHDEDVPDQSFVRLHSKPATPQPPTSPRESSLATTPTRTVSAASAAQPIGRPSMASDRSVVSSRRRSQPNPTSPGHTSGRIHVKALQHPRMRNELHDMKAFDRQKAYKLGTGTEISQAIRDLLGDENEPGARKGRPLSLREFLESSSAEENKIPARSLARAKRPMSTQVLPDRSQRSRKSSMRSVENNAFDVIKEQEELAPGTEANHRQHENVDNQDISNDLNVKNALTDTNGDNTIREHSDVETKVGRPKFKNQYVAASYAETDAVQSEAQVIPPITIECEPDADRGRFDRSDHTSSFSSLSSLSGFDLPVQGRTALTSNPPQPSKLTPQGPGTPRSWGLPQISQGSSLSPEIFDSHSEYAESSKESFDIAVPTDVRPEDIFATDFGKVSSGRDVHADDDEVSDLSAACPPDIGRYKYADQNGGPLAQLEHAMLGKGDNGIKLRPRTLVKQEKSQPSKMGGLFGRFSRRKK